jgi:hypothetical protein
MYVHAESDKHCKIPEKSVKRAFKMASESCFETIQQSTIDKINVLIDFSAIY